MNDIGRTGSNWTSAPKRSLILAWLISIALFGFIAVSADQLLVNIPRYWRDCISAFGDSSLLYVLYLTVTQSFIEAVRSHPVSALSSPHLYGGLATALYGTFWGMPPIIVPIISWVLGLFLATGLSLRYSEATSEITINAWPYYMAGILITVACWLLSRRLW